MKREKTNLNRRHLGAESSGKKRTKSGHGGRRRGAGRKKSDRHTELVKEAERLGRSVRTQQRIDRVERYCPRFAEALKNSRYERTHAELTGKRVRSPLISWAQADRLVRRVLLRLRGGESVDEIVRGLGREGVRPIVEEIAEQAGGGTEVRDASESG